MRSVNRSNRTEKGAVLVLVAAALLVLTGMAAIALDGGMAYNERRSTQNAADNAALAGAWSLCETGDPSQARQVAIESAVSNGFPDHQVQVPLPDPSEGLVEVRITSDIDTSFGRTQGVTEMTVVSGARASCEITPGESPYALFTGARPGECSGSTMELSSGSTVVNGAFHTNHNVNSNGSQTFTGYSTYVTPLEPWQVGPFNSKAVGGHGTSPELGYPVPDYWSIDSYAPGGERAVAAGPSQYHLHPHGLNAAANTLAEGLHFVQGNVNIWPPGGGNVALENRTIVATGTIQISANIAGSSAFESDGLLLFANGGSCHTGLQVSASNGTLNGIIYVPNGKAQVNTSQMVVNGGIISLTMNLAGSNNTINGPTGSTGPPEISVRLTE